MVHMKFLFYEELLNIWKKAVLFYLETLPHISTDIMENYHESPPNIPKPLVSLSVSSTSSSSSSSVICQTTGPKPLPKRFLHILRSRASSFNWQYPLLSLRSSSSFLLLLPRLLVTSICSFIFPSIICFTRQFLRKMWPIQLAFRFLISFRIFLCSLTLSNTSSFLTWSVQLIFSILLQHHISKLCRHFYLYIMSKKIIVAQTIKTDVLRLTDYEEWADAPPFWNFWKICISTHPYYLLILYASHTAKKEYYFPKLY